MRSGNACLALPGVLAVLAMAIALFAAQFDEEEAGYAQGTPIEGAARG